MKRQQELENGINKAQHTKIIDVGYSKEDLLYKVMFADNFRDDPNEFIEILKTVKNQSNIPFKIHIVKVFQDEARSWWDIVQHKVTCKAEHEQLKYFIELFKIKFLGLMFQQMVTNDLATGRYDNQYNKLHPCAYFGRLMRRARSCPQLLIEEEICDYIARHFGTRFEDTWIAQPQRTADSFYELLEQFGTTRIREDIENKNMSNHNNYQNTRVTTRGNVPVQNNQTNDRGNPRVNNNNNNNSYNRYRSRGPQNNYNQNNYRKFNNNNNNNFGNNSQQAIQQISGDPIEENIATYGSNEQQQLQSTTNSNVYSITALKHETTRDNYYSANNIFEDFEY